MNAQTQPEAQALAVFQRRPDYFWTTKEEAILRATYPERGASAVQALLPWRTLKGIYTRAAALGLKSGLVSRSGFRHLRWPRTDELDTLIRAEYPHCLERGSIDRLAQRIGRPSWWVRRTAAHLGISVPRQRMPEWQPAEEAVLKEHPHLGLSGLNKRLKAAGYIRSETAIAVRLKKLHLSRMDPDVHSARDLALLMGVDPATVRRWIEHHGLIAVKNTASEQSTYRITRKNVRAWVLTHVDLVDIRRVDKWWFVEMLAARN